MTAFTKGCCYL